MNSVASPSIAISYPFDFYAGDEVDPLHPLSVASEDVAKGGKLRSGAGELKGVEKKA